MDQFWAVNHRTKNSAFLNYILSVIISLILTGCLQDAHVTERQSGQTALFSWGFEINPEGHWKNTLKD